MAIRFGNRTGHSIKKFLEAPFTGQHPKLVQKGTKTAAAEAAEVAAETEAAVQQEQTERLAPEVEALGGGACTAAQSVVVEAADAAAASKCHTKAVTAAHEDRTRLEELDLAKDFKRRRRRPWPWACVW